MMTDLTTEQIKFDPNVCEYLISALQTHTLELEIRNDALFYTNRSPKEQTDLLERQDISNASITCATDALLEATWKWIQESKQYRAEEAYILETNFLIHVLKKGYSTIWNKIKGCRDAEIMAIALSKKDKYK